MESVLPPPPPFTFVNSLENATLGNISKDWEKWRNSFKIYFDACELTKKDAKVQTNILLHVIGEQGREVYEQFQEKPVDLKSALAKFDAYFLLKKNITVQRHCFFTRNQKENESIEQYSFELKKLAVKCEFKDLCDDLVRDRLICGIKDSAMRERLLREPNLTLQKSIEICNIAQMSKMQAGTIKKEGMEQNVYCIGSDCTEEDLNQDLNYAYFMSRRRGAAAGRGRGGGRSWRGARSSRPPPPARAHPSAHSAASAVRRPAYQRLDNARNACCQMCGMSHINHQKCPAYGRRCLRCNRLNHFSRVCKVYELQSEHTDQVIYYFNHNNSDWSVTVDINKVEISFKIDTGADVNVLPSRYLHDIGLTEQDLIKTAIKLRGYSGGDIKVLGRCFLKLKHKNIDYILEFLIADVNSPPILGRQSCQELNLVKLIGTLDKIEHSDVKSAILNEYTDVFEGIGCMPGEYRICTDESVRPVVHAPRKLPVALKDKIKLKLDEMEKQKIIAKVEGPTDWVNSMTVVRKPNGDLRICLDPKDLNNAIKREHYRLPTIDEITANLSGAKFFSTLDAKNGFWQLRLSPESTALCTFNTAFGRYKFLRLPYGITSASEVFHKKLFECFDDLGAGICLFVDDLLIYGRTREEHDTRLRKVLDRCRKINLKLNLNKCKFTLTEIKYLGHKITREGIYPDESHTSAIRNMPKPENYKDLERFLGLVNYVGKFVKNMSDKTHHLRQLLKKDIEWHWDSSHQQAFDHLKKCLTEVPVLQYFDVGKPVVLSVDSSKNGLGVCLLQNGLPVSYASRSLTKAEQNYAQIEKELLACVYACEKFYSYIYGKNDVIVETDHKPLVNIIRKPIADAPARLQRMLLRLQLYTFKMVYKPGKFLYIADTLSRAVEPNPNANTASDPREHFAAQAQVCAVVASNPLTDTHFMPLQKQTQTDIELQSVMQYINNGWPDHKQNCVDSAKPYWCYKDELFISYDLVWKGNRVVVPKSMRNEMLKRIHIGHLGLEKCKLRARETIFWPNINSQLEDYITKCGVCLSCKNENKKETMISHDIPNRAWSKIGTDCFHFNGEKYLLVIDYYSKFIEVIKLSTLTSEEVINNLKTIFSRHGIPDIVMSDNGPEYSSSVFKSFASEWCFKHVTSSPRYAQSNGQSERAIQEIKKILRKTCLSKSDFRLALLEYLNTPISSTLASPAELLNNRRLRSIVPCSPRLLKPKIPTNVKNALNNRQQCQKAQYDKGAKDMAKLTVGQRVKVRVNKKWVNAVVKKYVGIRSYSLQLDDGGTLIRNRRHLLIDTSNTQTSDYYTPPVNYSYDDITLQNPTTESRRRRDRPPPLTRPDPYVTSSGRVVQRPDRWGFDST